MSEIDTNTYYDGGRDATDELDIDEQERLEEAHWDQKCDESRDEEFDG